MHYLSSVYFVNQPLHVSRILVAHHQEVYYIFTKIGTCCAEKRDVQNNLSVSTYHYNVLLLLLFTFVKSLKLLERIHISL